VPPPCSFMMLEEPGGNNVADVITEAAISADLSVIR
jgi:hypothetical protein